jgi:hypothetical protein
MAAIFLNKGGCKFIAKDKVSKMNKQNPRLCLHLYADRVEGIYLSQHLKGTYQVCYKHLYSDWLYQNFFHQKWGTHSIQKIAISCTLEKEKNPWKGLQHFKVLLTKLEYFVPTRTSKPTKPQCFRWNLTMDVMIEIAARVKKKLQWTPYSPTWTYKISNRRSILRIMYYNVELPNNFPIVSAN